MTREGQTNLAQGDEGGMANPIIKLEHSMWLEFHQEPSQSVDECVSALQSDQMQKVQRIDEDPRQSQGGSDAG